MAFGKAKSKANLERIQEYKRRHIQECKRRANYLKNQEKNKYKTPPKFRFLVKASNTNIIAQALSPSIAGYSIYAVAHYHELEYFGLRAGPASYTAAYCVGRLLAHRALRKLEMDDVEEGNVSHQKKDDGNVEVFQATADVFYVDPPEAVEEFLATADVFYVDAPEPLYAAPPTGNHLFDAALEGALDGGLVILGSSKDSKQLDAELHCKKVHAAIHADLTLIKQPPNELNRPQSAAPSSEMATAKEKVRALMTMSSEQFCHGSHLQELRDSLQVLSEGGFFKAGSADMIKKKFAAVEHDLPLAEKATQELEAGNKVAEIVDGLKTSLPPKIEKCQNLQREFADLDQEIVEVEKRLATLKKQKEDKAKGVQQLFQETEADAVVYEGLESQLDKARSERPSLEAFCIARDASFDSLRAVLRPFFP